MTPDTDLSDAVNHDPTDQRYVRGDAIDAGSGGRPALSKTASFMDSQRGRLLHARLLGYFDREIDVQAENRALMSKDHNAYDGEQWEPEDMMVLEKRGQVPLVFNLTATLINWLTGTERRARKDFKVLPRTKEDGRNADRKTALLKYLDDVNNSAFGVSEAFEDCVKAGVGWLECGAQDDPSEEPIYDSYVDWRDVLWDSLATRKDLKDARYMIRSKYVDLDYAIAMFPKRRAQLEAAALSTGTFALSRNRTNDPMDEHEAGADVSGIDSTNSAYARQRVRIIECWYRDPMAKMQHVQGPFRGDIYDPDDPHHVEANEDGRAQLRERTLFRMHVCLMTETDLLWVSETPYRHNRFPFTPIWCYRRGKNKLPYGVVRAIRDIQFDANKRASKALAIMSSNKTMMEEGAVDDIDEWQDQAADPNGVLVFKRGYARPELNVDRNMADGHVQMFATDIQLMHQMTGINQTAAGTKAQAISGVAKAEDKESAQLATAGIFDNLRLGMQLHGEKVLSLAEQFMHESRQFRITNMRGTPEWQDINTGADDDITRSKADYVISQQDWRASMRQAQVEALFDLLKQIAPVAPQVVVVMLDLLVESIDLPQRDELVKRIRDATGMRDPDQAEPTPEEIQKMQKAQEAEQRRIAMEQATIEEKQASARQKAMQAIKLHLDGGKVRADTAKANTDVMAQAIEIALAALTSAGMVPGVMQAADEVVEQAGMEAGPQRAVREMLERREQQPQPPQPPQPQQQLGA